jgi:hypothetical protein
VCPGQPPAEREDAVRHRERAVGANTELGARIGDILGGVIQRERAASRQDLLGIDRQAIGREVTGGIRRHDHDPIE